MPRNGSLNYSNKAIKTEANCARFRFQFSFNPKRLGFTQLARESFQLRKQGCVFGDS